MKKECKCYICSRHIDRGACDNDYVIVTHIDNRPSPIKKERSYICQYCILKLQSILRGIHRKADISIVGETKFYMLFR